MIPIGIAQAAGIFVGNSIGEGNIKNGKIYANTSSLSGVIWGILSLIIMHAFKQTIVFGYSSDAAVNQLVIEAYWMLSYYVLIDCV